MNILFPYTSGSSLGYGLGLTGGLKSDGQTDPWIRQHASRLLPCLPATGPELGRLAQQLGLRLA